MDKNTIIGFLLIIAVVIGFSIYTGNKQKEVIAQQEQQDSIGEKAEQNIENTEVPQTAQTQEEDSVTNFFSFGKNNVAQNDSLNLSADSVSTPVLAEAKEEIIQIENEKLIMDISTKGGQIVNIILKEYKDFRGDSLELIGPKSHMSLLLENKLNKRLDTKNAIFTPIVDKNNHTVKMRLSYSTDQYIDFVYTLEPESYMIKFDIVANQMQDILSKETQNTFVINWEQALTRKEKSIKNSQRHSSIHYKLAGQSVEEFTNSKDKNEEITSPIKWVAFKDHFFAIALISENPFETTILDSKTLDTEVQTDFLKYYAATLYTPVNVEGQNVLKTSFNIFAGPLEFFLLRSFDAPIKESEKKLSLDRMIPLGWTVFRLINQYFVIPLFSLLKSFGLHIGLVIFLLTVIVKLIISPLTYKSFMSSAKMRVLRPQVEEINKKYPKQEQAMEKQQAVMSLYNKVGVSPMSGCIPMLLQMPILLALFSFFPSAIELRQQSFLWAADLSTYDAIIEWDANIPLISWALGNHLSLFCVLMTITNIVYTKFNMDATNTGQQQMPGMKLMMYVMPVFLLFILNDYPAGLNYYYFLSTLITILLTLIFRWVINEEKVLAKLEANKAKPKKKSGFMARLEEAQRLQQQQMRAQSKANAKKKKY